MNFEEVRALAHAQLKQGQTLESQPSADSIGAALACYDQAIGLWQSLPPEGTPPVGRRDHAVAWMNRGNILQRIASDDALAEAIFAYEQAIGLMQTLPLDEDPFYRNSLGAAWMNRGHALQRQATPAAIEEAVRSHGQAIFFLQALPLDENRSFRLNLAAAWMNQANAMVILPAPAPLTEAAEAARTSLSLMTAGENSEAAFAEMALRARLTLAHVLTQQIPVGAAQAAERGIIITELSDVVDDGMTLLRHWEKQGFRHLRPLGLLQYRIGAHFYLAHQTHFLAEFLLESLDPEQPGNLADAPEYHTVASEAITQAMGDLYNKGLAARGEDNRRTLEIWRELKAAAEKINYRAPGAATA